MDTEDVLTQNDPRKKTPADSLKKAVIKLLVANHLPLKQAEIFADCLIEGDLCGVPTHGVSLLPAYINKIREGGFNLSPNIRVLKESGAFAVIDSDNALGAVSAAHCMNHAIERSQTAGMFTVFSRNSNTYGPAFYYAQMAAKKNLIGITFCNTPAAMPPWNGRQKLLGTNPFAVAVPGRAKGPLIFDMATSKVAKSKINQALQKNQQIPSDWALDENGIPTTDPLEAIKGLVLPMAEYKGYGLALTIDILSGVLSGASFLNKVGKFYSDDNQCMDVGQTFIVIDPAQVYGGDFFDVMDEYADRIRSSLGLNGEKVLLPGDRKQANKKENSQNGLQLEPATVEKLNKVFKESGLDIRL